MMRTVIASAGRHIRIQVVLYKPEPESLARLFASLAMLEKPEGVQVSLVTGDCSDEDSLSTEFSAWWRSELEAQSIPWTHTFFGQNLGYGAGHNRLFSPANDEEDLLVLNPDVLVPAHLVMRLHKMATGHPGFGMIEARQIPLEHPKPFDAVSKVTPWASGCCALISGRHFRSVAGFDELFFLYGEDVDLSWRVAAAGGPVLYCVETFVYHSKTLGVQGPVASENEEVLSVVGHLILRRKYGRLDLEKRLISSLQGSPHPVHAKALEVYSSMVDRVRSASALERQAAVFSSDGQYGLHRWSYSP